MKLTINKTTRMGCQLVPKFPIVRLAVWVFVLLMAAPGQLMAEGWDASDNPARLSLSLETHVNDLPKKGDARYIPWAGSCWETFRDSINTRWAGASSDAPATKYGKAFSVTGVADAVSEAYGIDSRNSRKSCTQTSECDSNSSETCAKRGGQSPGVCIPTWWGICHAWAPLSIILPEPKISVEFNGVHFRVNDIKALLSVIYTQAPAKMVGERCDEDEPELDEYSRPRDDECRNTNAGTWHVILINIIGLNGKPFIIDQRKDGKRRCRWWQDTGR